MIRLERRGTRLLVALAWLSSLAWFPSPVAAFDDIERLLPALARSAPEEFLKEGFLFEYIKISALRTRRMTLLFDSEMRMALDDRPRVLALTGVDTGRCVGALSTGLPPNERLLISGAAGFADGMAKALPARGFTQSQHDDFTLFAKGRTTDGYSPVTPGDPFAHVFGVARIFQFERLLVSLRGEQATAEAPEWLAHGAACASCDVVRPLLESTRTVAGVDAELIHAVGTSLVTFIDTGIDLAEMLSPADGKMPDFDALRTKFQSQSVSLTQQPFVIAVLSMTKQGTDYSVHIALAYGAEAESRAGAAEIAKRLGEKVSSGHPIQDRATPAKVDTVFTTSRGLAIAVITPRFAAATPEAAVSEFNRWLEAIVRRDFYPLAIFG